MLWYSLEEPHRGTSNENPQHIYFMERGLSGVVKVLCILHHRGVQLISAYSWASLLSLQQIRVEGGCFISSVSSLSFIFLFFPCPSLSSPLQSLLSLFSLSLGDDTI